MDYNFNKVFTLEPLRAQFLIDGGLVWKTEEFKDIPDYEGFYQVSDFGRVKSLDRKVFRKNNKSRLHYTQREKILTGCLDKEYYHTVLYKESKSKLFFVSVLVAMAFLNHKPDGNHKVVVDHKDNIKSNNYLYNLQLITNRENSSKDKFRGNYTSKHIGVCWHKRAKRWVAGIEINGKSKYLGCSDNEIEASELYQKALKELL